MLDIMTEVAGAAGAAAAVILVFFGAALASFDTYNEGEKDAVRSAYRRRAWPALVALIASTASCGVALYAKAGHSECAALVSIWLLGLAGIGIVVAAIQAVWEIG
jgi:hypothetical protein